MLLRLHDLAQILGDAVVACNSRLRNNNLDVLSFKFSCNLDPLSIHQVESVVTATHKNVAFVVARVEYSRSLLLLQKFSVFSPLFCRVLKLPLNAFQK